MKNHKNYKQYYFENFVSPFVSRSQHQNATDAGPDTGMTSNMINNTFPSSLKQVRVKLPFKKKIKKKKV